METDLINKRDGDWKGYWFRVWLPWNKYLKGTGFALSATATATAAPPTNGIID